MYGPSEYEEQLAGLQVGQPLWTRPPPFVIEGSGGSAGTGAVATVSDTEGMSSVVRVPVDALSIDELTALRESNRGRGPVVWQQVPLQSVFAGRDAPLFSLEVPLTAFNNTPGTLGFVYTAQLLITTGEPVQLPPWLHFYDTYFTADKFQWNRVPYIDEVSGTGNRILPFN